MAIFASRNYGYAEQDKGALLDYSEDWSGFLVGGDTIAESNWSADSAEILLSNATFAGALTTVWVAGGVAGKTYRITNTIVTLLGRRDLRTFILSVTENGVVTPQPVASALFNRFRAVEQFKNESLAFLDRSFPVDKLTDEYIWDNLVAAEAEASRQLRVFLQPTVVIPEDASQTEVDALRASGKPFVQESAYDYDPSGWTSDAWGYIIARKSPIIRVDSVKFTYPNPNNDILTIPIEWVRLDKKYGHVRFVPTGAMMALGPMSTYIMTAISSGRIVPNMIHIRYVAGLENAAQDYPDLVKVVKRMAILSILKNAFLPQSSSISADGLSQSISVDTDKWAEGIDHDLGLLRDAIHGVRLGVM